MSNACINLEIEVPSQTRYLRMVGNVAEQIAKAADANNADQDTLQVRHNHITG